MSILNGKIGGFTDTAAMVNLAAAGAANAAAIYTLPSSANLFGNKTVILKKIRYSDNGTGGTFLHIGTGTGAAFVDLIPPIKTVSGFDDEVEVEVEAGATITAYPVAVGGSSIDVQPTVDIKG